MSYIRNQLGDAAKRLYDFSGELVRVFNHQPAEDSTSLPTWTDEGTVLAVITRTKSPEDKIVAGGEEVEIDAIIRLQPDHGMNIHGAGDDVSGTVIRHEPDGQATTATHEYFQVHTVAENATGVDMADAKRREPLNL